MNRGGRRAVNAGSSSAPPKRGSWRPKGDQAHRRSSGSSQLDEKELNSDGNRAQIVETLSEQMESHDSSSIMNISSLRLEIQLSSKSPGLSYECNDSKNATDSPQLAERSPMEGSFDICMPRVGTSVTLKPSLFEKNREKRNEMKRSREKPNSNILRPGMLLLKSYLSMSEQVKIVKQCRNLGLGAGGFYQPCYHDGAKLHLRMMCLGKNWDPETSRYGDHRPVDNAKPPSIPKDMGSLVARAIKDSHALICETSKVTNAEDVLPQMTPNICIVNFYSTTGRLGLHQDRDESEESLRKGLPVVSFSIGDTAEFLYGDSRDVDKAEKVMLESGDVLIFGGQSRHIFHGVASILQDSAPKVLLQDSELRSGRLNLTFREY